MNQPRRAFLATVLSGAASAALPFLAHAQVFPDRPVRIVVGFPPGGATDVVARLLAERLGQVLRQSVFVDNKPGVNGNIGADFVAKSRPDGHTLLFTPSGHVISRVLYPQVPFDPIKDFEPVSLVAQVPFLVVANPKMPGANLREMIAFAKANPGKLTYGTAGSGTINHLAMELLKQMAGIDVLAVPYKGGVPAQTDVIGGYVDMMVASVAQAAPLVADGKLKALALAADARIPSIPSVPTSAESGLPGFAASTWLALLAPAGTPAAVAEQVNTEVARILQDAEVRARLARIGVEPLPPGPRDQLRALMQQDQVKWGKLIADIGIKAD